MDASEREHDYRKYVTNSLQASPQGKYIVARWSDIIDGVQEEDISVEERIEDVVTRAGLTVVE